MLGSVGSVGGVVGAGGVEEPGVVGAGGVEEPGVVGAGGVEEPGGVGAGVAREMAGDDGLGGWRDDLLWWLGMAGDSEPEPGWPVLEPGWPVLEPGWPEAGLEDGGGDDAAARSGVVQVPPADGSVPGAPAPGEEGVTASRGVRRRRSELDADGVEVDGAVVGERSVRPRPDS